MNNNLILAAALLVSFNVGQVLANALPEFDVVVGCREMASRPNPNPPGYGELIMDDCFERETKAREELKRLWFGLTAHVREDCLKATTAAGQDSYWVLLYCVRSKI